jgi:hypothetical protein
MPLNTVSILDGNAFVVSDRRGDIDATPTDNHGLFIDDTRFLSRWILTINGIRPAVLSVDDQAYFRVQFFEALTTGTLRLRVPGVARLREEMPEARGSLDLLGVNYYTRAHLRLGWRAPFVDFRFKDVHGRGLTDLGRSLDPDNEGLFTWWAPWRNIRQRNIGGRIDYIIG